MFSSLLWVQKSGYTCINNCPAIIYVFGGESNASCCCCWRDYLTLMLLYRLYLGRDFVKAYTVNFVPKFQKLPSLFFMRYQESADWQ